MDIDFVTGFVIEVASLKIYLHNHTVDAFTRTGNVTTNTAERP